MERVKTTAKRAPRKVIWSSDTMLLASVLEINPDYSDAKQNIKKNGHVYLFLEGLFCTVRGD
jgi:hypothetical protein